MSDNTNERPEDHPMEQRIADEKQTAPAAKPELQWTGGRYSPKAFRFRRIMLFLFTLLCVAGAFCAIRHGLPKCVAWSICLGVPAILWIWLESVVWYRSYTIRYHLEEDKLVTENGFLNHVKDSTLIAQINDIKISQTLWDKLVNGGVGTVTLFTTDVTDPELKLRGLEEPHKAFETIDYLRKEYVRKRGIKSFGTTLLEDGGDGGM